MAAHRYWRLYITACNSSGGYPSVDTIQLFAGGANLATNPANAYASSSFAGATYAASLSIIGQPGYWSANSTAPCWWAYDLGAGVSADITSISMLSRPETSPGWDTTSPTAIQVQWSDDNAAWTTAWTCAPVWTSALQTLTLSAPPTTLAIQPNNANIVYSPYNWTSGPAACVTWNPGAYFRTLFSGTTCALTFDVSLATAPVSQFWWRIDAGPWTLATVAANVPLPVPSITLGNAAVPLHRLEVVVKSMDIAIGADRWTANAPGAIRFTGLLISMGGALAAPGRAPLNVLIYGDSITEGARTLGETNPSATPTDMDAMFGWAFAQGALLGAEVGICACSGTGFTVTAYGVPPFPQTYNLLSAGVARSFTPAPDLVVIAHGQNDQATNVQAAAVTTVNGLLAVVACKIVLLNPFPMASRTDLQAAAAACNIPSRVTWANTTGFFVPANGSDASLIHPSGPNSTNLIAPKVATILRPVLTAQSVVARWTHWIGAVAGLAAATLGFA